jgi:hypothetical protein
MRLGSVLLSLGVGLGQMTVHKYGKHFFRTLLAKK